MFFVYFILILVLLILVHEFGHFIVAKFFNIRVDEFGIFFPPRMFAIKKGETEYSLNWLPFGGFVKIFGENYDEGHTDPRSFVNKSRWAQAAVIVAGIVFNLLFAWFALSAGYIAGLPTSVDHRGFGAVHGAQSTVVGLVPNSPAEKSGILAGDTIEKIQTGTTMFDTRTLNTDHQSDAVRNFIAAHQDESMIFIVQRQGSNGIEEKNFLAKPVAGLIAGQPDKKAVGVELDDVGVLQLPVHLALVQGAMLGWDMTQSTALGLATFFKQIVTGTANFAGVAGPIGITAFGAAALKQGFAAGIFLTALISINLALINLIPIPGLDGGRLLIIAIEGVTKKRLPTPVLGALTLAGFALLILLMLVVSYHDIAKLVG